jgi:hypothetical protein
MALQVATFAINYKVIKIMGILLHASAVVFRYSILRANNCFLTLLTVIFPGASVYGIH